MKLIILLPFFVSLTILSTCTDIPRSLIINANIVTEKGKIFHDKAILIENQLIKEIDSQSDLMKKYKNLPVIDIKHRWLYPGFSDAHLHILSTGRWLSQPDLTKARSVSQIQQILKDYIKRNPSQQWIIGRGWDQNNWETKKFPNKTILDEISKTKPILLYRVDGHAVWVNSKVLEIAGVDKNTPDPKGGKILRLEDGTPSGVLIDKATNLVTKYIPEEDPATKEKYIKGALQYFSSMGLTEVHDAYLDVSLIPLFRKLERHNELPLRVYLMVGNESSPENLIKFMQGNKPLIPDKTGFLTIRTIKTFADGALGSRGALLFEPYEDEPSSRGLSLIAHRDLLEICNTAKETGYQVATHAIGDSACHFVLKTFIESAGENTKKLRWRIEHSQILFPQKRKFLINGETMYLTSFEAFARFGIIPSMQPVHCISDMPWVPARIGKKRARYSYAWKTLISNGAIIPAGTDCPVEPADPILNFYAAVTRKDTSGKPEKGWFPEEKVDRLTSLKMLTTWPAYASFKEDYKGKIKPGYLADFTVLDKNILDCPEEEILKTRVEMTIVGGKVIYSKKPHSF